MALSPCLPPCQRSVTPALLQRFQPCKAGKPASRSAVRLLNVALPETKPGIQKLRTKPGIEEKWGKKLHSRGKPTILPSVSYKDFKEEHRRRQNSTTPTDRHYADHSIGGNEYNTSALSYRIYRPRVIRISSRSKITLYNYHEPFQPRHRYKSPSKRVATQGMSLSPQPKTQPEEPRTPEVMEEQSEPLALSYAAKLLKAHKVFREFL